MEIYRHWQGLPPKARGHRAALGNFDGLHLGHQAVIAAAAAPGAPLAVVTFEPHPRAFFQPKAPAFRLMQAATRARLLAGMGVQTLYELPFNADLAALTPEAFARDVLAGGLGLSHVAVGQDFRFGQGRAGDAEALAALGARYGFGVTVAPMRAQGAAPVSSSAVRAALSAGDPAAAAGLLGRPYTIEGPVLHGEKRGRALGFPTANQSLEGLHLPRFGIYAVRAEVLEGPHKGLYAGAASLGIRPMFGENQPNLETYLFDFAGDLYGAPLSVALIAYLRPEATFASLEAFIAQMQADCDEARALLQKAP